MCDHCHNVVGIPAQSAPRIADKMRGVRHALEARIPRQLSDVVGLACHELHSPECEVALFRYYVHRIAGEERLRDRLKELARAPEAAGPASARFSANLNDEAYARFRALAKAAGLNTAGVIRGEVRQELETVLRVAAG